MPENRAFLHKENFFEQAIAHDLRAISYVIRKCPFLRAFFRAFNNIDITKTVFGV